MPTRFQHDPIYVGNDSYVSCYDDDDADDVDDEHVHDDDS
jgi:hypothetical protein